MEVEPIAKNLRDIAYDVRSVLSMDDSIPLSINEGMCMFLGKIFKWGGPASNLIKVEPIAHMWQMFVHNNRWRKDFIHCEFSTHAAQMFIWLQQSKDQAILQWMKRIIIPAEFKFKSVRIYTKKGFQCLEFSHADFHNIYNHLLQNQKGRFYLKSAETVTKRDNIDSAILPSTIQAPRLSSILVKAATPKSNQQDSYPKSGYAYKPYHKRNDEYKYNEDREYRKRREHSKSSYTKEQSTSDSTHKSSSYEGESSSKKSNKASKEEHTDNKSTGTNATATIHDSQNKSEINKKRRSEDNSSKAPVKSAVEPNPRFNRKREYGTDEEEVNIDGEV